MASTDLPAWHRVGPSGTINRTVHAPDLHAARLLLPCGRVEYVTSAASFALGLPKPLRKGMCPSCGLRPRARRMGLTEERCTVCGPAFLAERVRLGKLKRELAREPLTPRDARDGRTELERRMAMGSPTGRPKRTLTERSRLSKARHEQHPDRRAAKTEWQRAKRRSA